MKCVNHLDKDAVGLCNHCGKSICSDCSVEVKGERYCKECLAFKLGQEKKEERSPALAAILSFIIGGLGQVYNGQVGKGILIFFSSWLIIPWIIGIIDAYNVANKINKGIIVTKSKPGCLIAMVVGVVIFFMGVFLLGLLAAIAIPNFLRARLGANEYFAKTKIMIVANAAEAYRAKNNGRFPSEESELTITAATPYLAQPCNNKQIRGYDFAVNFAPNGYNIIAVPKKCGSTGSKIFKVETGAILSYQDCKE